MHLVQKEEQLFSISQLADMCSVDRRTMAKILSDVDAKEKRRGHNVYSFAATAYPIGNYLVNGQIQGGDARKRSHSVGMGDAAFSDDPDDMHPKDRKDWFQSELYRTTLETTQKKLIPAEKFVAALGQLFKAVKSTLVTLPDVLEQDAGLDAEQVAVVIRVCHGALASLATQVKNAILDDDAKDEPE